MIFVTFARSAARLRTDLEGLFSVNQTVNHCVVQLENNKLKVTGSGVCAHHQVQILNVSMGIVGILSAHFAWRVLHSSILYSKVDFRWFASSQIAKCTELDL